MTVTTASLLIVAAAVLYLAVGRGALAVYGRATGSPMSYKAIRATAKGTVTTGQADLLTGAVWLVMLLAWPLVIAFFVYASLRRRIARKPVTVTVKGVVVSIDPTEPEA